LVDEYVTVGGGAVTVTLVTVEVLALSTAQPPVAYAGADSARIGAAARVTAPRARARILLDDTGVYLPRR
jgi:hypothetical protein